MIVKMKLTAKERRAGVDLRDVIGPLGPKKTTKAAKKTAPKKPRTQGAKKPKPDTTTEFRPIEFVETLLHDPVRERWDEGCDEGGVRMYCTSNPITHGEDNGRWALQVRARVKLRSGKGSGKHFAVGTASMSREDLLWLRAKIDAALGNA